ncbi:MAG: AsnC family transcriptional regulator [Chloroflexota bacterium]|nr:AsnC family transcriptional regulator [Chloroflexota bacterium]
MADIARQVGLTRTPCKRRIEKTTEVG